MSDIEGKHKDDTPFQKSHYCQNESMLTATNRYCHDNEKLNMFISFITICRPYVGLEPVRACFTYEPFGQRIELGQVQK